MGGHRRLAVAVAVVVADRAVVVAEEGRPVVVGGRRWPGWEVVGSRVGSEDDEAVIVVAASRAVHVSHAHLQP